MLDVRFRGKQSLIRYHLEVPSIALRQYTNWQNRWLRVWQCWNSTAKNAIECNIANSGVRCDALCPALCGIVVNVHHLVCHRSIQYGLPGRLLRSGAGTWPKYQLWVFNWRKAKLDRRRSPRVIYQSVLSAPVLESRSRLNGLPEKNRKFVGTALTQPSFGL